MRHYFPTGGVSAHKVSERTVVALALNTIPRKALGGQTPAEVFN
jgi:IS30 family transposase